MYWFHYPPAPRCWVTTTDPVPTERLFQKLPETTADGFPDHIPSSSFFPLPLYYCCSRLFASKFPLPGLPHSQNPIPYCSSRTTEHSRAGIHLVVDAGNCYLLASRPRGYTPYHKSSLLSTTFFTFFPLLLSSTAPAGYDSTATVCWSPPPNSCKRRSYRRHCPGH